MSDMGLSFGTNGNGHDQRSGLNAEAIASIEALN